MHRLILYLILYITPLTLLFAGKIDNYGRIASSQSQTTASRSVSDQKYASMIIKIEDESAINDIEALGAIIPYRRENILLAYVPSDMLDELEKIHHTTGFSLSRRSRMFLNKAVPATKSDKVLSGNGFEKSYSGNGVVVGFSDLGFDAGHAAFGDRVRGIVHSVDSTATIIRTTKENWTTDSPNQFHATHVGGILAGADDGSQFQGVARGADIIATTSTLDDVGILVGVEEIISYAKKESKPAVINLSLGSTLGPHDGTDLFCQYLDLCAEDAAILLAVGNDGESKIHASGKGEISVMIESYRWNDIMLKRGYVDMWSSDARPVDVRFRVWDHYTKKLVYESEWVRPEKELCQQEIPGYFSGKIMAASEVSPYNGRYNVTLGINMRASEYYPNEKWARHALIIDFKGSDDAEFEAFAEDHTGFYSSNANYPFITGGESGQSLSSMACGQNIICVGSATTAEKTPLLNGGESSWTQFVREGTTSNYSSYGTTYDGRPMPHFCAPGAYIVSAFNRYALERYPDMVTEMAAVSPSDPASYYFAECGTSMATPHAAGIFALWLEANPSLTPAELREIAIQTADAEGVDMLNPRTGAGMIDAEAGLKHILRQQGLDGIVSEEMIKIWREGTRLCVSGMDSDELFAEIFSLSGIKLYEGPVANVSLSDMPVIVKIKGKSLSVTRKLM